MNTTTILRDALTKLTRYIPDCDGAMQPVAESQEGRALEEYVEVAELLAALAAADADQAPVAGELYECTLVHCVTGEKVQWALLRVDEDDCDWRTADDHSEIANSWEVTAWRKDAALDAAAAARPAPVGAVQTPDAWITAQVARHLDSQYASGFGAGWNAGIEGDEEQLRRVQAQVLTRAEYAGLFPAAPAAPTVSLTFDQIEDAFPDGAATSADGYCKVSAQWLHDFAANVWKLKSSFPAAEHAKPEPVEHAPLAYVLDFAPEAPYGIAEEALTPDEFALYSAMSDISEERWFAGWMGGNEYELWSALQDGEIGDFNRNTLAYIAAMSVKTGKWIMWHSDADASLSGPRAVSLFDWMAIYDAKNDMRAGQQAGAVDGERDAILEEAAQVASQMHDGTNGGYRTACMQCATAIRELKTGGDNV